MANPSSAATTAAPVCVTGASGYIAGFIVKQLLEQGFTVHGTVRDPDNRRNDFLRELAVRLGAVERLRLFKADLEETGSFDKAIKGCRVVIHTAAVVTLTYAKDPFSEVINPTVNGVRNVIESCLRLDVLRVVYTSSVATIACAEQFRPLSQRGTLFTEEMWLTHTSPTYATYNYAKIEAEKLLNQLWGGRGLISILPSWTVGPQLTATVSSSNQMVRLLANRERPLPPLLYFDMVDVRDVAAAHVFAATSTSIANGRYNCTGCRNNSAGVISEMMNESCPGLCLPTRMAPWIALYLLSFVDKRISTHMIQERTQPWAPISNEKIRGAGFQFQHTDLVATLGDAVRSLRDFGVVAR
jgi:nucleoside-diphosphate-sugar epimerase